MPRLTRCILYVLLAGWIVVTQLGCSHDTLPAPDVHANSLGWSANIDQGRDEWLAEARKRFPDPFVFMVHGDTRFDKAWWVAPDDCTRRANIEAVGWLLHGLMPDRDVLLISCNDAGYTPHLPKRVWYCKKAVWSRPARACLVPPPPNVASSVWDFEEGKE